jgi:hypothetical protein
MRPHFPKEGKKQYCYALATVAVVPLAMGPTAAVQIWQGIIQLHANMLDVADVVATPEVSVSSSKAETSICALRIFVLASTLRKQLMIQRY